MARMTLDDMKAMVRLGLGGETTETISDTMITRLINQSYMEVCSTFPFPELEDTIAITTSSGTAEYELGTPTDTNAATLVIDDIVDATNGMQLKRIKRRQYSGYTQGLSADTGTPVYYFISGVGSNGRKNVTFYPTPAGTYTINAFVRVRPAELVSSPTPTSPILQEPWDDSIIQRAISRGWKLLGDPDLGAKFNKMAMENDMAARAITLRASEVPTYQGSIVGRSWRG